MEDIYMLRSVPGALQNEAGKWTQNPLRYIHCDVSG